MRRLLTILIAIGLMAPAGAYGATLTATPSTFSSVYSSAQGGDTILLASGSYPAFKGGSKPSRIVVKSADGGSVTMAGAQFVGTANITLQGIKFTSGIVVRDSAHDIILDGDTFDGLSPATWEGRVSLNLSAHDITIKNSHFGGGGCSDGIFLGNVANIHIGPGNVFDSLKQGNCGAHVDSIQFYGDQTNTVIDGNLFTNDETGIMEYDGGSSGTVVSNNAMRNITRGDECAGFSGAQSPTVEHNSLGANCDINFSSKPGLQTTKVTVRNNVSADVVSNTNTGSQPTYLVNDYNLAADRKPPGSHSITCTPVFAGGASFASVAGAQLASTSSCGYHAASDGASMGVTSITDPLPPPPLPVDTDHDGVPDNADACPTVAGAQADGCPVPPPPPPDDPCAQTKADRDQALADLAAMTTSRDAWKAKDAADAQALADMTASRDDVQKLADAYKARALKAEDQVARIRAITGE